MEPVTGNGYKPKHKGTRVLFNNPVIERLSRTHISIPISMFGILSIVLMYYGFSYTSVNGFAIVGLFITGFLLFTLVEYIVHRYVFHMEPDTDLKQKIQYNFHGVHHEYPKDKERLAMPPLVSAVISVVLFYLFKFIMGDLTYGFLPGFMMGYSSYLFVHFAVHAFQPPKNFIKILWVNHGIHHYKDHDRAFGVSSPLWDYVFRTLP